MDEMKREVVMKKWEQRKCNLESFRVYLLNRNAQVYMNCILVRLMEIRLLCSVSLEMRELADCSTGR